MGRFGWACAGACIAFGFLGILTIGLPFLVGGVVLAVTLSIDNRSGPAWPAPLGAAAVFAVVGLVNLGWQPALFFVPAAVLTAAGLVAGRAACARL